MAVYFFEHFTRKTIIYSSVMLATTRQRIMHIDNNNLDVHIGDYKLVQSDCIDYLGVTIDETISWNKQTDIIKKRSL